MASWLRCAPSFCVARAHTVKEGGGAERETETETETEGERIENETDEREGERG
jgi:hypothetical protein